MGKRTFLFGVHNDEYNIDFYDDLSIDIYNHKKRKTVTSFDAEAVAVFIASLDKDGFLDKLLEYDRERMENLFKK